MLQPGSSPTSMFFECAEGVSNFQRQIWKPQLKRGGLAITQASETAVWERNSEREGVRTIDGWKWVQSNPLNGSPDNGSIRLLVQVLVSPISQQIVLNM